MDVCEDGVAYIHVHDANKTSCLKTVTKDKSRCQDGDIDSIVAIKDERYVILLVLNMKYKFDSSAVYNCYSGFYHEIFDELYS